MKKLLKLTWHLTKFVVVATLALGFCYGLGTMLGGA